MDDFVVWDQNNGKWIWETGDLGSIIQYTIPHIPLMGILGNYSTIARYSAVLLPIAQQVELETF